MRDRRAANLVSRSEGMDISSVGEMLRVRDSSSREMGVCLRQRERSCGGVKASAPTASQGEQASKATHALLVDKREHKSIQPQNWMVEQEGQEPLQPSPPSIEEQRIVVEANIGSSNM